MGDIAIRVENLSKRYRIGTGQRYKALRDTLTDAMYAPFRGLRSLALRAAGRRPAAGDTGSDGGFVWALRDVSFEVEQGEALGIIGRNGAGKTTVLKVLSRVTEPTRGWAEVWGRVGSLLEVGTGFHPELTGRENVYLNGAILGMTRSEIARKFDEIVSFAEVERFIDTPVKRYSSGMQMRLAFAVAAHLEPEILLVDEVLAVGDAAFQKKCMGKMGEVAKEGRTVLFISHNMGAVLNLCTRGILLDAGEIRCAGPIGEVVTRYMEDSVAPEGEVLFPDVRPGAGRELKFLAIRILGTDGEPNPSVDLLKGFVVQMDYQVVEPVPSAQVAFELWNSMGVCVLSSTDLDALSADTRTLRQLGRYRASCFVPRSYLRAGRYWIDLSSSVPGVRMLDEVRNAIAFEVLDTGSAEFRLGQSRRGVVAPLLEWETANLSEVPEL
jgi:lipopolysaccharide transport system ATP-binding protein